MPFGCFQREGTSKEENETQKTKFSERLRGGGAGERVFGLVQQSDLNERLEG